MALTKVTMNISDRDRENADFLKQALECRSQAHVVSIALELLRFLADARTEHGAEFLLRHENGDVERIVVPELQKLRQDVAHAAVKRQGGAGICQGGRL